MILYIYLAILPLSVTNVKQRNEGGNSTGTKLRDDIRGTRINQVEGRKGTERKKKEREGYKIVYNLAASVAL